MSVYGTNISLLEYKGNDIDNQDYREVLEDLDELFKFYIEIQKLIAEHVKKCANIKVKDEKSFKKALNDLYNDADDTNAEFSKRYKDMDEAPTFKRFNQLSKKFSVKYSNITMEDKKKYTEIFMNHYKDLVKIADQFDSKWVNDLNDSLSDLRKIDREYTGKYVQHVQAWYNAFYSEFSRVANNMRFFIYKLDTKRENTLRYQLIQRIIKD